MRASRSIGSLGDRFYGDRIERERKREGEVGDDFSVKVNFGLLESGRGRGLNFRFGFIVT